MDHTLWVTWFACGKIKIRPILYSSDFTYLLLWPDSVNKGAFTLGSLAHSTLFKWSEPPGQRHAVRTSAHLEAVLP